MYDSRSSRIKYRSHKLKGIPCGSENLLHLSSLISSHCLPIMIDNITYHLTSLPHFLLLSLIMCAILSASTPLWWRFLVTTFLGQDADFQWLQEQEEVFQKIKDWICQLGSVGFFDQSKLAVLQVDASQEA